MKSGVKSHAAQGKAPRLTSGAQTPVAAIFAALILVFILLLIPEVTLLLPLPAMAGAILLIAWGLIDDRHIRHILRRNRQEALILLVTFVSILAIELEFAIYLGVILSLALYLRRTSRPRLMEVAPRNLTPALDLRSVGRYDLATCPQKGRISVEENVQKQRLAATKEGVGFFSSCAGCRCLWVPCLSANMAFEFYLEIRHAH